MNQPASISRWKFRHSAFVWVGIVLNFILVLALLICPERLLDLFGIPVTQQLIWPRFSALLLGILSIFYIPATFDIDRYRIFAWLAVFPSRTLGALFFFIAVFVFNQPLGFIVGVLLDGSIGVLTLFCLIRIAGLEQKLASGGSA
jgi:hypothetical protein